MPDLKTAPAAPLLPPDEWDVLRRLDALEAQMKNLESVLALAVQVATTAAEQAKAREAA
jgi:hypothetical protein